MEISEQETCEKPTITEEKTCCKKKHCCNMIVNLVLGVGLIVLYILFFTTNRSSDSSASTNKNKGPLSIAFINSDSLMVNFEYVKEIKTKLEAKQKELEGQFVAQQAAFENQVMDFQKKIQANAYTNEQAQLLDKQLGEKQQNLATLKENLATQLANEEQTTNSVLQDSLTGMLKTYNKKYNYDFIFGYAKGSSSGIMLANEKYDITKDFLKEINKAYKEKAAKK